MTSMNGLGGIVLPAIPSTEDIQDENKMKFAIAISLLLFSACAENNSIEKSEYFLFLKELKKIESLGSSDITSHRKYFSNPAVKEIYENTSKYLDIHQRIWLDPSNDIKLKILSVRLAQCLPKNNRISVLRYVFEEYKKSNVSSELVETFLLPGDEWSTWWALHYNDSDVVKILSDIKNDPQSSNAIISATEELLSGSRKEYIEANNEGNFPKIICGFSS
jgi:hypothetical protein